MLALVGVVALWAAVGTAAERPKRSPAGAVREPVLGDDPEPGYDEDSEPGDNDLDEGRALPSEPSAPTLRAPVPRPVPRGEEEEPPLPGETPPVRSGPAEPASAAQPLSPG